MAGNWGAKGFGLFLLGPSARQKGGHWFPRSGTGIEEQVAMQTATCLSELHSLPMVESMPAADLGFKNEE